MNSDEKLLVELGDKLLRSERQLLITKIKLDAMKEGMRRAAEKMWPESTDLCYGEDINYITRLKNKRTAELKQSILTAAEQLTEADL